LFVAFGKNKNNKTIVDIMTLSPGLTPGELLSVHAKQNWKYTTDHYARFGIILTYIVIYLLTELRHCCQSTTEPRPYR